MANINNKTSYIAIILIFIIASIITIFIILGKYNKLSFTDLPKNNKINVPKSLSNDIIQKYNFISYNNNLENIPCNNHAQIPCNFQTKIKCDNTLSNSEIALLYKKAYELAGESIILRTLQEQNALKK